MCDENGEDDQGSPDDRSDAAHKTCEYCGAVIDTTDWYPVVQRRAADGTLQFYSFCSESCQASWVDD